jgi:membrane-bound metal-dependent hydrolase YbcI (DUF457 family)
MPSPVGHGLAGLAIALLVDRSPDSVTLKRAMARPTTLVCVALATLPDADLLIPGLHRRATHSVGATIVVTILAIVVTGWVNRSRQSEGASRQSEGASHQAAGAGHKPSGWPSIAWRLVALCAAAHASHILTDWLGADRSLPAGIQALWPWSDRFFMSGWDLFPQIERRNIFSAASMIINLNAFVWEVLLMLPLVAASWWVRRAGRAGGPGRAGTAG